MVRCLTSYEYGEARAVVGIDSISLCRGESCAFWVWWICQVVTVMRGMFWFGGRGEVGTSVRVKLREVHIIIVSAAALNGLQRHSQVGLG